MYIVTVIACRRYRFFCVSGIDSQAEIEHKESKQSRCYTFRYQLSDKRAVLVIGGSTLFIAST